MQKIYLNNTEASKFIGVSKKTLATWRSTGKVKLPFIKLGHKILYRESDLIAFLDNLTVTSTAQARLLGGRS